MSEMDKGAFIRSGYTVEPGIGGSFVVFQGPRDANATPYFRGMRGFSNWQDLTAWLVEEHQVNASTRPDEKASSASEVRFAS